MKSSTVRRSALSKESINVIENLANEDENNSYNQNSDYNNQDNQTNDYYKNEDIIPHEYVRTTDKYNRESESKSKEIDLLWQSFKSAQFNTKSPFIHILGGFITGVITTIIIFALLGVFTTKSEEPKIVIDKTQPEIEEVSDTEEIIKSNTPVVEDETVKKITEEFKNHKKEKEDKKTAEADNETISEETSAPAVKTKKYIIKDGDTVEAIIKHEYGAYTPERAEAIMKVNNMPNLDRISIDQVLLLPVEK